MGRKYSKRSFAVLLAAAFLVTACSHAQPGEEVQPGIEGQQVTVGQQGTEFQMQTEPETDEGMSNEETGGQRYQAEWTKDAVIYEVNVRQYTEEGTFAAFSEHLQEIKDMGVNTLWFMPIHPISVKNRSGVLGSYYSVTDYREVNPEFGTKEDFKVLIEQAHDMGFHVMLDWVANHTGWDCAWIEEHPEWYTQDAAGNIISPAGMGWPDVADLNFDNRNMRAEMISCMKYWVEEFDVDGFRCDYASGVPTDFWEDARTELETIKPVYMLAEDDVVIELLNSAFDFNYNLDLYNALIAVARDNKKANVIKLYIPQNYPDGTYTMNFLDNHDKNSYEHTIMEAFGADTIPAMFSLIYTIPGVPMVYTGDEIGLDHNIAFMEKDTINWDSTGVSYRELLMELAGIRSSNPALYSGNYGGAIVYYDLDNKNIFAFCREQDGNVIKCLFNLSKREQIINVDDVFNGTETVLLYGQGAEVLEMEDHAISEEHLEGEVTLQPWEFWIVAGE